ncbi:hypothetical protein BpHYR1_007947 [Brachionus plicatilis]|uniref:Uncharacterized protein n=1 Tax=Brachionus plicatilis TaxID=10195 RepID=A0A3M7SM18_BRAPC|nr:hypothetical protein BpHYR1_007947 [Brachionus plicatilis]
MLLKHIKSESSIKPFLFYKNANRNINLFLNSYKKNLKSDRQKLKVLELRSQLRVKERKKQGGPCFSKKQVYRVLAITEPEASEVETNTQSPSVTVMILILKAFKLVESLSPTRPIKDSMLVNSWLLVSKYCLMGTKKCSTKLICIWLVSHSLLKCTSACTKMPFSI